MLIPVSLIVTIVRVGVVGRTQTVSLRGMLVIGTVDTERAAEPIPTVSVSVILDLEIR